MTGTRNAMPEHSERLVAGPLLLDTGEWDKIAFDWEHRGLVTSRRTDRAIFRVLLWFILILGGVTAVLTLFPALSPMEHGWESPLPAHAETAAFTLFIMYLFALAMVSRRRYGRRVSRIEMEGAFFGLVAKGTKERVRIPAERVDRVEVREAPFSSGNIRITLVDMNGQKYTLEHLSDPSSLGRLEELCRDEKVAYRQGRESRMRTFLKYGLGASLFLLWLAAIKDGDWYTPAVMLGTLLLSPLVRAGRE